jgi:hypothetical protein
MPTFYVPLLFAFLLCAGTACSDASRLNQLQARTLRELNRPLRPGPPQLPSPETLQKRMAFLQAAAIDLDEITFSSLQPTQKKQYETLRQQLTDAEAEVRALRQDPSAYHFFEAMAATLPSPPFSEETLGKVIPLLQKIPAYYGQARQNLTSPSLEGCRKAVSAHLSVVAILVEIGQEAKGSTLPPSQKAMLRHSCEEALLAVKDYIAWCNSRAFEKDTPRQLSTIRPTN